MKRALSILAVWGLLNVAGLVAVGLGSWTLKAVGMTGLITPLIVLGVSALIPLALVAADHLVPGRARLVWAGVPCPHCGHPVSCVVKDETGPSGISEPELLLSGRHPPKPEPWGCFD